MLSRLIIRNYAIISELDLVLKPGLSVITGETGAGKSILLGALGMALGRRADSRVLPDNDSKCIVEAHFQLKDDALKEIFVREELDYEKTMICRREISAGGKSRTFINDTPVQLKLLQEISGQLIELHQQHDSLALQSREYQTHVLDVLSSSSGILAIYKSIYKQLTRTKNELKETKEKEFHSARRKDFLVFQINELENAQLKPGEIETLEETQNILQHAEDINQIISQLKSILSQGPHSINHQLINLGKQLNVVRKVSAPLSSIADRLDALRIEVQDLDLETLKLEDLGQNNPAQLSNVESRLNQLYTLIKKYQVANDTDLVDLLNTLKCELSELTSVKELIEELEHKISILHSQLFTEGEKLTKSRSEGAQSITPKMNSLIHELGMPNGKFSIRLAPLAEPGPDGMDEITFLFSANKGVPMQPLQSVASGGEISRLSLAMKSLYAEQAELPTIIFDEIDSGISGEVAWRMGQLIKKLAKGHQILMITHSPQIAAHAVIQYHVLKTLVKGRDTSSIQLLTLDERLIEIAKMLSGDPPSKEALANAKSLVSAIKN